MMQSRPGEPIEWATGIAYAEVSKGSVTQWVAILVKHKITVDHTVRRSIAVTYTHVVVICHKQNYYYAAKVTRAEIKTTIASHAEDVKGTRKWMIQHVLDGPRTDHDCCKIDEHQIIIVGGVDDSRNLFSSGVIYDGKTHLLTSLPNDMPADLSSLRAVNDGKYGYVFGGYGHRGTVMDSMYRLSLETYQWNTMAPMGTARYSFPAVLKGNYIYVFGGCLLKSAERYSIVTNTWEDLPGMAEGRYGGLCAVATAGDDIYVVGGNNRSIKVCDTAWLKWKTQTELCNMSEERSFTAAVLLKDNYLVVIGGKTNYDGRDSADAGCLIFDIGSNNWSSTPISLEMNTARWHHNAAVLDGKSIIVAGGWSKDRRALSSIECIDADALLEYAPLLYLLPDFFFNKILQLFKGFNDNDDDGITALRKKLKSQDD
eukprot:CAMPEP_0196809488 /NCGR_PEP_ID=MMETSP1362-20130617/9417_1 /TAXON_ID=163516 /ORGANISM="Leptocylindrus danicus, Strain CCMP1856" /LENGTH=427 /DNA_ID=CAMNT_0042184201 /DNA_START=167 /DNA_END=1450 /DNA_ORIENTATION=+